MCRTAEEIRVDLAHAESCRVVLRQMDEHRMTHPLGRLLIKVRDRVEVHPSSQGWAKLAALEAAEKEYLDAVRIEEGVPSRMSDAWVTQCELHSGCGVAQ